MNGFVARTLSIVVLTCLLPALNELDGIAAAFAFGMADEKIGFTATGRTFCRTVAWLYDILCIAR